MPEITIPFNSFSNILTEDNSTKLLTADNVVHDLTGYESIKALSEITSFNAITTDSVVMSAYATSRNTPSYDFSLNFTAFYNYSDMKIHEHRPSASPEDDQLYSATYHVDDSSSEFSEFGSQLIYIDNSGMYKASITVNPTEPTVIAGAPSGTTCAVIKDFLLAAGDSSYPRRLYNSAINDVTGWTYGTNQADYADLPDVGNIIKIIGGETGIIFGDKAIARIQYVGGDTLWQIDIIEYHKKLIPKRTIIKVGEFVYYVGTSGIYRVNENSKSVKISEGKYAISESYNLLAVNEKDFSAAYDAVYDCIFFYMEGDIVAYKIATGEFATITADYGLPEGSGVSREMMAQQYVDSNLRAVILASTYVASPLSYALKAYYFGGTAETPDLITTFQEIVPNQWVTIKRVTPISETETATDIDILSYDSTKTLIDTVTISTTGGAKIRQTGRFFKFKVQSTFARMSGLKIEYELRGGRS